MVRSLSSGMGTVVLKSRGCGGTDGEKGRRYWVVDVLKYGYCS